MTTETLIGTKYSFRNLTDFGMEQWRSYLYDAIVKMLPTAR